MISQSMWEKASTVVGEVLQLPLLMSVATTNAIMFIKLVQRPDISWFTVATPVLIVLGLFVAAMLALIVARLIYSIVALGIGLALLQRAAKEQQQQTDTYVDEQSDEAERVMAESARRASKVVPLVPIVKS